jgi:DNA-binding MarR family transcriptional regulator
MAPPRSAFGAPPSRGRHQRPGEAGSAVARVQTQRSGKAAAQADAFDGLPSLERTLTYRMHQVHKLTDQESQRLYPLEVGVSLSDGRCLAAVGSFEPVSVNQLAQLANLNKAQASRAAQSLAEQGLVRKADAPGDGRGVLLTLTPRGRKAWHKTMDFIHRRNEHIFGCLSPRDQALLGDLFDRLIAHNQAAVS